MTTDRALDILAMSEQARWREGIEPEDERKAIETIREALQSKPSVDVLDKIRAEIEQKIEQERFARSVFRGEEKDAVKAEQCTGSIFAYNNVIRLIGKYKAEQGVSNADSN